VRELLDELRGSCGIKDVLLDRNVLIIELLEKPERRDGFTASAETGLSELLRDGLESN